MSTTGLLQDFISNLNANIFLREFAFSRTLLPIAGKGEIEIADHLVLLDDLGLAIQLKERDASAGVDPDELGRWFKSKVMKKAVQQLKATRRLLAEHAGLQIRNDAGHEIQLPAKMPQRAANLVIYRAPPVEFPRARFYPSKNVGFIHLLPDLDYFGICGYLATPVEVVDYLDFRQQVLTHGGNAAASVSEAALVGQYLAEKTDNPPNEKFAAVLGALRDSRDEWDLSFILANLGRQVTYQIGGPPDRGYYPILVQLAKFSRSELRVLKERLRLAVEAVKEERFELPYRFAIPRLDCGFLVFPIMPEMKENARAALRTFSLASKYEHRVSRQVGLAIWRTNGYIDIEWLYTEGPNEPNPELDEMLARNYPFRATREKKLPRYLFDSDALEAILDEV